MNQPPNNPYGAPPGPGGYGPPGGGPPGGGPPGYVPPGGGPPPGFGAPGAPPPYMPPGAPNFAAPGGGSGNAAQKVSIPATLMLIFSGLAILVSIANIVLNVLGVGLGALSGDSDVAMNQAFSGVAGIVGASISILLNAIVVFGAIKMKKLEGYTFALVSAILFTLPCSLCCFFNTPIGIWAIVTLVSADVKAAFRS